jgi:formate dehydrogenase major subunit
MSDLEKALDGLRSRPGLPIKTTKGNSMALTRRRFLQVSGTVFAGITLGGIGFDMGPIAVHARRLNFKSARESKTICPFCSVGCGAIVHSRLDGDRRTIHIEGDPDHVVNRGSLCSKGAALYQFVENEDRLTQPMYRAPYSTEWEPVSWDWALDKIAHRIKQTRDAGFTYRNDRGNTVNRTANMASMGSAAMNNEECWLYQALLRALGLVCIEHQARL